MARSWYAMATTRPTAGQEPWILGSGAARRACPAHRHAAVVATRLDPLVLLAVGMGVVKTVDPPLVSLFEVLQCPSAWGRKLRTAVENGKSDLT